MLNQLTSILSFLLLLAVAPALRASEVEPDLELSLDELLAMEVTTVSRKPERLDHSPGTVYVITQETIKQRGYKSLKDVLETIPGFNVFHKDLMETVIVRGLAANDNEKVTLLINGIEMNQVMEPVFLDGPINLDSVERVEVIVGPSSIFRPANTLAATINVITKETEGTEVVLSKGTDINYGATVMHGHKWSDEKKFSIAASLEEREGYDAWGPYSEAPNSTFFGNRHDTGKSVRPAHFIVISGQYNDWSGQFVMHESVFPEYKLGTASSLSTKYLDRMRGGYIQKKTVLSDVLTAKLSYSLTYKQMQRSAPAYDWLGLEQWDHNTEAGMVYTGIKGHTVQFGLQGLYENNGETFFNDGGNNRQTFYDKDTWGAGLYVDDSIRVNDKFKLVAGIRADYNTLLKEKKNAGPHFGGRLAGIYDVTDNWTSKLMYNRTVRMPSPLAALNEIWGSEVPNAPPNYSMSPKPDSPEVLQAIEFNNIWYLDRTRLSLTGYYQWLDDYITWANPYSNVGSYKGWGIESDIQHKISNNLKAYLSGAYNQSKFDDEVGFGISIDPDKRIIGAPALSAHAGLEWNVRTNICLSPRIRYWTDQPIHFTNDGGQTYPYYSHVNNRYYVDVALLFKNLFRDKMDISISAFNILDNQDLIGSAWRRGQYSPRGAALTCKVYFRF